MGQKYLKGKKTVCGYQMGMESREKEEIRTILVSVLELGKLWNHLQIQGTELR